MFEIIQQDYWLYIFIQLMYISQLAIDVDI